MFWMDDTTMLHSNSVINIFSKMLMEIEKKTVNWFSHHKLKLNGNNTQNMIVSSNNILTNKNNVKLLGITIEDMLKWESFIDVLSNKLSIQLFLVTKHFLLFYTCIPFKILWLTNIQNSLLLLVSCFITFKIFSHFILF